MFRFPALPVKSFADTTLDFEKLQTAIRNEEVGGTGSPTSVAMAYRNAAENIGEGGFTKIVLDKIVKDPGNNFHVSGSYYETPSEGYYHVDGQIATTNLASKAFLLATIRVNEAEERRGDRNPNENAGTAAIDAVVSGVVFCKAGDKIELWAYNSGAISALEVGSPNLNYLNVFRIGEGAKGEKGSTGSGGGGGGDSFPLTFEATIHTEGEPETGGIRLNSANVNEVTDFYASEKQASGGDIQSWWTSMGLIRYPFEVKTGEPTKGEEYEKKHGGVLRFSDSANTENWILYRLKSDVEHVSTEGKNFHHAKVEYLGTGGTMSTAKGACIVTYRGK